MAEDKTETLPFQVCRDLRSIPRGVMVTSFETMGSYLMDQPLLHGNVPTGKTRQH